MTLLGAERVYDGRVIGLDVDTVRFPDGSALTNPSLAQVTAKLDTLAA